MLALANDGKLSLTTLIRSPTRTKNQWINVDKVSALAVAVNQAKLDAATKKKSDAEELRQRKLELVSVRAQHKREEREYNTKQGRFCPFFKGKKTPVSKAGSPIEGVGSTTFLDPLTVRIECHYHRQIVCDGRIHRAGSDRGSAGKRFARVRVASSLPVSG